MGVWIETFPAPTGISYAKSHPAWVCGLKQVVEAHPAWMNAVTPCVGVWIETSTILSKLSITTVTPCVGVWIETLRPINSFIFKIVTPCVGVWIETAGIMEIKAMIDVTPCVGVWIETVLVDKWHIVYRSHPAWVCGLKLSGGRVKITPDTWSHPAWVCGLKLIKDTDWDKLPSHTLRGCVD